MKLPAPGRGHSIKLTALSRSKGLPGHASGEQNVSKGYFVRTVPLHPAGPGPANMPRNAGLVAGRRNPLQGTILLHQRSAPCTMNFLVSQKTLSN